MDGLDRNAAGSLARFALLTAVLLRPVRGLHRYISDPSDQIVQNISSSCGGNKQTSFESGKCPVLLRCVLDKLPADVVAGMQSGGNVASLVPTILTLIGAAPMDLVQMALLSPHRALATCCFSIGLPVGLFRQLKPLGQGFAQRIDDEPCTREWLFNVPTPDAAKKRFRARNAIIRVTVDLVIMALASVMLWFNWQVNKTIMITWRCEYGWLLFAWPLACMGWLLVATLLLYAMIECLEIKYKAKGRPIPELNLGKRQFMALPYMSDRALSQIEDRHSRLPMSHHRDTHKVAGVAPGIPASGTGQQLNTKQPVQSTAQNLPVSDPATIMHPNGARYGPVNSSAIIVRITMPSEFGLRSWRWYEAIIETLAVGIYLYATFVLTSTQFLSGQTALIFATVMALALSLVRILGNIF